MSTGTRRVQWHKFSRPLSSHASGSPWTAVHLWRGGDYSRYDKTLCGEHIDRETAAWDGNTSGRVCKRFQNASKKVG